MCLRADCTHVGIGPVAHEIAQAPQRVGPRFGGVGEHRLERLLVAVDVGKDRYPHTETNGPSCWRWPALVAAVVVVEAAVFLFRPRDGVIEPAPVSVRSYFPEAQLDRARDFRRPQLAFSLLAMGIEAGVLILAHPPPSAGADA